MKLTRNEALEVYGIIENILKKSDKVKMNFRLFEEQEKIEPEKKRLEEVAKFDENFMEFERKRIELCKKHCRKNENGDPIVENNTFIGLDGNKEYNQLYIELRDEYKEDIEKAEEKNKELNELLTENIEIEFKKIDVELIPDGIMNGTQMKKLKKVGIL